MKGLYIHNTSGEAYECVSIKNAAQNHNVCLIEPWKLTDADNDIAFTFNRSYFAKNSVLQQGGQINDFYRGLFWKDKRNQINYLNTYIKKPKTIINAHTTFDEVREQLGMPFIAKRSISSQGKGVFMVHNPDEFMQATACDMYQEPIWNSIGRDLRIWVLGGEILGIMQRQSADGDFRANIHMGGVGTPYKADADLIKCTDAIYRQTQLDIMGIDVLFGDDGYYFCELNVCPGFHGFDECFGINTADHIIEYLLKKVG